MARERELHADRPAFHIMPKQGWLNDPNGPLYYNGKYHMFYQHLVQGCEWAFGLVWGHAVSTDLVHWEHLPEALLPTPGGVDADGCFSGCATVDNNGQAVILFTGVRLRGNPNCGPLPPPERDLQLPFVESQCFAVADAGCANLSRWHKSDMPFLSLPPPDVALQLAGWRDPFIIHKGDGVSTPWVMLLGSGIKGRGGTALMYYSLDLYQGWQYAGMLCSGNGETGLVWECPILLQLQPLPYPARGMSTPKGEASRLLDGLHPPSSLANGGHLDGGELPFVTSWDDADGDVQQNGSGGGRKGIQATYAVDESRCWFFCISPDAPTNPVLYWLGTYTGAEFDIANAKGPLQLDLGDVLYAPNILEDDTGRLLLWGWLQERRKVGAYDYSGCLTVPRVLHLRGDKLHQTPAEEVDKLRTGQSWYGADIELGEDERRPLEHVGGCHLDLEVSFVRSGEATASGLVFKCWDTAMGEGDALLLYHWERQHLEVVVEGLHPETLEYSTLAPTARRMGGAVEVEEGEELQLRVLLDYSCLEVFVGTGEVLSTRMYRGSVPPGGDVGIEFVSVGGCSTVNRVAAYEVGSIWKQAVCGQVAAAAAEGGGGKMQEWCEQLTSQTAAELAQLEMASG